MRRSLILITCLILILSFSGCAMIKTDFKLSQNEENVQLIEIYEIEEIYDESNIDLLRDENTPIAILKAEERLDCLEDIKNLKFEKEVIFFPIPMDGGFNYYDYVIVISYFDGSYDLLAEDGQFSYSISKGYKYDYSTYCGDEPWDDLIEKYIEK